jgi:hypothetical protein
MEKLNSVVVRVSIAYQKSSQRKSPLTTYLPLKGMIRGQRRWPLLSPLQTFKVKVPRLDVLYVLYVHTKAWPDVVLWPSLAFSSLTHAWFSGVQ